MPKRQLPEWPVLSGLFRESDDDGCGPCAVVVFSWLRSGACEGWTSLRCSAFVPKTLQVTDNGGGELAGLHLGCALHLAREVVGDDLLLNRLRVCRFDHVRGFSPSQVA